MGSLLALSPPTLELKKGAFNERTYKFFSPEGRVSMHELEILLNDEFMLEMSLLIAFETKDIVTKSIQAYLSEKIDQESRTANGKEEGSRKADSVG